MIKPGYPPIERLAREGPRSLRGQPLSAASPLNNRGYVSKETGPPLDTAPLQLREWSYLCSLHCPPSQLGYLHNIEIDIEITTL